MTVPANHIGVIDRTPCPSFERGHQVLKSWYAAVALLAYVVGLLSLLTVRYFDPDEFEHVQFSWMISQGLVPYKDFFESHTPLTHFLLS